jgi:transcription-repair coupling factor (superfamily II helicase)
LVLELIQADQSFNTIYHKLTASEQSIVYGLTNSAKSFILANIFKRQQKHMVFVVQNFHEAQNYHRELSNLLGSKHKVLNFLVQQISPYDQINPDVNVTASQYEIFRNWQQAEPSLVICSYKALSQLYIAKEIFENETIKLKIDQEVDPVELSLKLTRLGYIKQFMVENRGQFSIRGDIVDIYPMVGEPSRIELFGDNIESIREFSIGSQRSTKKLTTIEAEPRYSVLRKENDNLGDRLLSLLKEHSTKLDETQKDLLEVSLESNFKAEDSLYFEGVEYYREFLDPPKASNTLFDYLPDDMQLVLDEWQDLAINLTDWQDKLSAQYKESLSAGKLLPLNSKLYLEFEQIKANLEPHKRRLYIQTMPDESSLGLEISSFPSERFSSKVEEFVDYIKKQLRNQERLIIYSEQPQRVSGILKEWDIKCTYLNETQTQTDLDAISPDTALILRDGLDEGCKFPDLKLVILTDRELFGKSRQAIARQKSQKRKDEDAKAAQQTRKNVYTDIAEIRDGDHVIHYKHGLGIYRGTESVELQGVGTLEYLAVEYAGETRVLIPVDQVNLLSRFDMGPDVKPKLSKLGGNEWTRTKKKVRKSVKKIAQDLVTLYAQRAKQRGHIYQPDTPWQLEMEDAFPYDETEDQLKAIVNVKQDMECEKLMDRLICGDAGFGKTEVIIRAIFKVIMEGKQVAVLVPTTVLAQQHFDVMHDRYAPYPIKMGLLSRFKSAKEQKETINSLKLGECDLVIGTHRLLQKDIQFKDLGLLVIDEEQRFGVSHKEKLKDLRKDLDVISMSATPIPRTLHMALSGIKDISLISTAPTNRLPIKTFTGEYKESILRNAILNELERGGKIFFLHNRVESIQRIAYEIAELVPEAKVRVAHGQMKPTELEDTMFSFVNNEFNVLVCTTIIETGLDISDANTILINKANNFGLSQLYQLRGRVGRSNIQAYAYLLYDNAAEISETARQRLKAIRELTNLGAGYQVALRDMEIRGVGNVFGGEQHGHMLAVGASLYFKMLEDAINETRGEASEIESYENSCSVDLKIAALFPGNWIPEEKHRMNEYKRLSLIDKEADLDILLAEWSDRFGRLPQEAKNLVEISRLKILANKAQIISIMQEGGDIKINCNIRLQQWLQNQRKLDSRLQSKTMFKPGSFGTRAAQTHILFKADFMEAEAMIEAVRDILLVLLGDN